MKCTETCARRNCIIQASYWGVPDHLLSAWSKAGESIEMTKETTEQWLRGLEKMGVK